MRASLMLLLGVVASCGSSDPGSLPPPPPVATLASPVTSVAAKRTNDDWNRIRRHFNGEGGFVSRTLVDVRDPFEPQLVKFVPRPDPEPVAERPKPATDEGETSQPEPVEGYQARDYRVSVIRWGTSVNKAVVQDPEGRTFVVTEDAKLGGGRVVSITEDEVRVLEPSNEEPVVLSAAQGIRRTVESDADLLFPNRLE